MGRVKLPNGKYLSYEGAPPSADELDDVMSQIESPTVTRGLFGTSIGEKSDLLKMARTPAEMSRKGLGMITGAIPDAETPSFPLNMALNTPKALLEMGSELSASTLDPESLLTAGVLKGAK